MLTEDPDALIGQAQGGDALALGALLERYRPYLTLLARLEIGKQLQGKADPADVVQDAFVEAVRGFPLFRGDCEPQLAAWLRRVLAGSLAMFVRRFRGTQARDVRLEHSLAEALDRSSAGAGALHAPQSSPSARASRREQAVLLADALERLPPDYREVIVLRHLEGLTFPEVADRMGRSVDAVEKLWARALPRLRAALGGTP